MNRAILMILAGAALAGAALALSVIVLLEEEGEGSPPAVVASAPESAPQQQPSPTPSATPDAAPANAGGGAASREAPANAAPEETPDTGAPPPSAPESDALASLSAETSADRARDLRPSFDVVRINPEGDAVMAGRAEPGAEVTIRDRDEVIGTVTADKRGEWVFVPESPLPSGSRQLDLSSVSPDGRSAESEQSVVLVIPERSQDTADTQPRQPAGPLALRVPRDGGGPTEVLQGREPPKAAERADIRPQGRVAAAPPVADRPVTTAGPALSLDVVDYDEAGQLILSGRAPGASSVLSYLDNQLLGRADPGDGGRWTLRPDRRVEPGMYQLRIDQVEPDGTVVARLLLPFSRAVPLAGLTPEQFVVVQPGNSLWRISRRTYGRGTRYSVIYQANDHQISDPDLIYPGQVFVLPPEEAAAGG